MFLKTLAGAIAALALAACGPTEPAGEKLAACGGNDVPAAAHGHAPRRGRGCAVYA